MANSRGTPLEGDRGAFDTVDHADLHALDIQNDALLRHLPEPGDAGSYARSDGTNWQRQLGLVLADLIGYVRGAIIRGGAMAWEVLTIGVAGKVLKSNGTDAAWGDVDHSELTGVGASDHHDPVTLSAGAAAILDLSTQEIGLDNQGANTVLAGPVSGADTAPDFRALVSDDLPTHTHTEADITDLDHTDANAIHDNVAGEIHAIADKATPVGADEVVVEDSADSWSKKRVSVTNLLANAAPRSLLFAQTVHLTVANTTDPTNLLYAGRGTKTIEAATFEQGDTLRITLAGDLTDTGTPSPTLTLQLGATVIATVTPTLLGVTAVQWWLSAIITITASGAGGAAHASGMLLYDNGEIIQFSGDDSVDTTAALEVGVIWEWDVANIANSIESHHGMVELLSAEGLAPVAPTELTAVEV